MLKLVVFDVDDVLYDATLQKRYARENAIRAMIDAGLPVDYESAMKRLMEVIRMRGGDYTRHFDDTLSSLGLRPDPRVIAAAVVAYHDTKKVYLKPYPGIFSLLLSLREKGYAVGVCTLGPPIKDWEKIIRLGMQHLFHSSWVGGLSSDSLKSISQQVGIEPSQALYITANPRGIDEAKIAGWRVIRVRRGRWASKEARAEVDAEVGATWDVGKAIESLSSE